MESRNQLSQLHIYQLFDFLRIRPGMYIGYLSPRILSTFIKGYYFGKEELEKPEGYPDFCGFYDWVAKKFGYPESTSGWANMIQDQCGRPNEAFYLFYELLDEFRGIRHAEIALLEYAPEYEPTLELRGRNGIWNIQADDFFQRPKHLSVRKLNLPDYPSCYAHLGPFYEFVTHGDSDRILDVFGARDIERILKFAQDFYGVGLGVWKISTTEE